MPTPSWSDTLRSELAALDCVKDTARLEALHAELCDDAPRDAKLTRKLATLCADHDANLQVGASWLLRARLEWLAAEGVAPTPAFARTLADVLPELRDKWARQHLCQCLPLLAIPSDAAPAFEDFLRAAAGDPAKFLRAWGLDGFVRLSWQLPRLADEARDLLTRAADDDAASVRARARKLVEEIERRERRSRA
ncbi:MAG: hypothetical protein DHS20C15_13970 [Planctomycetota bacterium]|nr:MAG: hypothetical protein DHS20C15_13970 [Planctomycetota bacterium]